MTAAGRARAAGRALTTTGTLLALAGTAHSLVNVRLLRRPPGDAPPVAERVSVLLPVRDEQDAVGGCLESLRSQTGLRDAEILVLDDGSTDRTIEVVHSAASRDPRVHLVIGSELPDGWLGKPYACAQLADIATGSVLVFVDADVRLAAHAVAASVALLRWSGLDLVCPYPRQVTGSVAERLVQPLLQWSWLTTLPLRAAERSARPSLTAANGQVLVVDADSYRRAGGHGAVRDQVLEDIALARAVKAAGGRGGVADGTALASCRMYRDAGEVRAGWTKSLWAAFGSPGAAMAVAAGLGTAYVVPAAAALAGSRAGALGYLAGVAGRVVTGRRTGARVWPDALAHPVSVLAFIGLLGRSWRDHAAGTTTWKGRVV